MRVLVCGGRDYKEYAALAAYLWQCLPERPTHIITGGCRGADGLAIQWARIANVRYTVFPANWNKYGEIAGPLRNQDMIDKGKPDIVVAFPGGRGTADMVRRATAAGIPVQNVEPLI